MFSSKRKNFQEVERGLLIHGKTDIVKSGRVTLIMHPVPGRCAKHRTVMDTGRVVTVRTSVI